MVRDASLPFNTLNQLTLLVVDKCNHQTFLSGVNTLSRNYIRSLLFTNTFRRNSMEQYRSLLARSNKFSNIYRLRDEEIIDHLVQLISERIIQVSKVEILPFRQPPAHSPIVEKTQGVLEETASPAFLTEPYVPKEEPNWIEFFLLDDESNEPFANVPIKLTMSNGRSKVLHTDSNGKIRLNDLPEGLCDIDEIIDEYGLEVIGIQ